MDCHACEFVSGHAAPLARAETTRELDKPSSLGRESSSGSHLAPILEECIIVNSLTEHYRRHTIFGSADGSRANRRKSFMTLELTCGYPHEFRTIPFCFRNSPDGGPKPILRKAAKSRKITGVRCLSRTHKCPRHHLLTTQGHPSLAFLFYWGTHKSPHSQGNFWASWKG